MDGVHRNVISLSLITPSWSDPDMFKYNPDFDFECGEFLSMLTLADVNNNGRVSTEQDQEEVEHLSPAWSANASGERPSKCLKLSLLRSKPCDEVCPAIVPMQDLTNNKHMSGAWADLLNLLNARKQLKVWSLATLRPTLSGLSRLSMRESVNRSFVGASKAVSNDLLASHDPQLVCKWPCCFVMEVRRSDGSSIHFEMFGLSHVLQ